MTDIAAMGREWRAVQAAERGDWKPLAELVQAGASMGDDTRLLIANKLTGAHKARRGPKHDQEADNRNQAVFIEFLRLRSTGECPSNETAYATIAVDENRTPDAIRKAVESGRQSFSPSLRHILEERWKQLREN